MVFPLFFMKICFISLGCDKNLVDTEMMMGMLSERGHELVSDETLADVAVVNTCSFISDAKAESINTLIKMERLKENGTLKGIIAAGCLAERYSDDIRRELSGVDVLIGTMAIDEIAAQLGYADSSYFARVFRKQVGMSPRQYRMSH